jgi:hypothetical protein
MNRRLKKQIAKALDAPAPRNKAQFVRSLPRPHISTKAFIISQIPFIKKSVWLLSVLIVLPAVCGASFASENTVWIVSAFTPFIALLLITESAKSALYGMNELEMASRFSLKNIVLARLTILGIFNFGIFCIIIPICHIANSISFMQTGVYLFVPYLLTTSISLYIVRCFRNKEAIYGCMVVAVCVSAANMTLRYVANFIFQTNYMVWWVIIALLLMMFTAKELYQTFKKTEGFLWNFALTD